jgi:ABC-2 type transport system permease protein
MRNTLTIAAKEVKTYFASPMAYIIAAVFLALSGFFFAQDLNIFQLARMEGFFGPASFVVLLLAPLLTMRLLAEEQKLGSLELLLTAPIREEEIVLGKYLSSLVIFVIMLAMTLYYPLILVMFADPDLGPIATGYLGLFLLGGCFLAVGLFASSLSSNQIVAAVVGLGISLAFWLVNTASSLAENIPQIRDILDYVSLGNRYSEMVRGVIDSQAVVFFLSFIIVALFMTVRSLETRRWR